MLVRQSVKQLAHILLIWVGEYIAQIEVSIHEGFLLNEFIFKWRSSALVMGYVEVVFGLRSVFVGVTYPY